MYHHPEVQSSPATQPPAIGSAVWSRLEHCLAPLSLSRALPPGGLQEEGMVDWVGAAPPERGHQVLTSWPPSGVSLGQGWECCPGSWNLEFLALSLLFFLLHGLPWGPWHGPLVFVFWAPSHARVAISPPYFLASPGAPIFPPTSLVTDSLAGFGDLDFSMRLWPGSLLPTGGGHWLG